MTEATRLTVTPIPVPSSLRAPEAEDFLAAVEIANLAVAYDTGHDGLREEPLERLGFWQDQRDWIQSGSLARDGDTPVGAVGMRMSARPDTALLEFDLAVLPAHRGIGVEEALWGEALRVARESGLRTAQTWTLHRPGAQGHRLESPTGWGSVPADDPQVVFLLAHGFELGQVERTSAYDLSADPDPIARRFTDAVAFAGTDYRLVTWTSPTPERLMDGFANVISRMSTDAPQGGTLVEEEHWDAARVRRRDARLAAQGLTVSVAAVEHVPTGALVAYNELTVGAEPGAVTQQYGTLVLREHRGHRLGMIVKCANILRWSRIAPQSPRIVTFNAEENRPMLDINEAIGFVPISSAGAWRKELV